MSVRPERPAPVRALAGIAITAAVLLCILGGILIARASCALCGL